MIVVVACIWLLMLLNGWGERYLVVHRPGLIGSASAVRLVRRLIDGIVLFAGLLFTLNYLGINLAATLTGLGVGGIAGSKLVAAALSRATFGPAGEAVVSIAVFLSAAGFVNATVIQMPRSFYAMAQDGVLPRAFLRVNPQTQVQEVGLLFFGATMLVPAFLLGSFEKLLNYVIFTDMLTLAVVASTLFVLRRRRVAEGGFQMPGYPLLPGFFVLCLLGVAARVFAIEPKLALAGIMILATGWPLFRLGHKLFGHVRLGETPVA